MPSQPLLIIHIIPHHFITSTIVFLVGLVMVVIMVVLVVRPNCVIYISKDDAAEFLGMIDQ